jgi:hypothetical protein
MTAFFVPLVGSISAEQLEDDWVATPMHISQLVDPLAIFGYTPSQIRTAYNLPSTGGAGATIAIIDAYDTPNILDSFNNFCGNFSLPDNSTGNFIVHKMPDTSETNDDWAVETCLDVEWAHAIAPEAKILLVEAKDAYLSSLFQAVDYATSQPGVVAVSMSWGTDEFSLEANRDYHFNKAGIVFFASSGDTGGKVIYPSSSPNVVAVGGTRLTLQLDGTVISETGWSGSGGGASAYEPIPSYQVSYGLNTTQRTVPDVSYNADPYTGVAVYSDGQWIIVGGTSAGAPQWAAIHALGLSATNPNLYTRAKSAYSSYFRDITLGSNGYDAGPDYDNVTGLGSPLTVNFGTALEVSPTSGGAGSAIALNGMGFSGSSVNISYLNTANAWVPIINNLTTVSGNFTYPTNAPDLLQSNPAGDNPTASNSIVFRAQDNSNGNSYNTTIPYTEWRRGLTQIANSSATGIYGNSTNFAASIFVQNGDTIAVCGKWFSPGTAAFQWDGTVDLGTAPIDDAGVFNTSLVVPATTAGAHNLTINDGYYNFCVNLTRLPTVANDYVDEWHTSDFAINLSPDYNVDETFYRINDGTVYNVTVDGQPTITSEDVNNTLEYWSTWNVYGTDTMELQHITVTGIKLDKTAPFGSITPSSSIVYSPAITLFLAASDDVSGVWQMRFSNGGNEWSNWESYSVSKAWTLQEGTGVKTVTVQYINYAGLTSTYSCTVTLATSNPTSNPQATASPTPTTQTTSPSNSPTTQPSATPQIPELNLQTVLIVLAASTLMLALVWKRRRK